MLTYKLIKKDDDILTYKYFPYGKDIKVNGGVVEINIKTKKYKILEIAELEEKNILSEKEKQQILEHINKLRREKKSPEVSDDEKELIFIPYKFLEKFINEIFNKIKIKNNFEKGIIL